jgi:hypothetical protein
MADLTDAFEISVVDPRLHFAHSSPSIDGARPFYLPAALALGDARFGRTPQMRRRH